MDGLMLPAATGLHIGIEVAGTLAFALSGIVEAARKKLDAVGVCVVAGVAAFGGGTLRDVLLDRRPLFWIEQSWYVWCLLILCITAMLLMRAKHFRPTQTSMQWPDALGLGLFAASGTQIALGMHMPALIAVLMGVITATFGGVLRDIVCNEIPTAFHDHHPYAVCAFAGGWVVVLLQWLGFDPDWVVALGAATATLLRLAALYFEWRLPTWKLDGDD
ncbi:trimeric intracellular cation channel family protein [Limnohabitans sp. TS-CS-82]|uniref:trimeric intracellular cation channel family protein n=1 Tax=Limnohabitans sp. TS-CS-82 TaxID=2094193 RepID=UPI001F207B1E|nr:trimeric intracellular cation channel family protein [Limnohabitans sp. TS-CS-82]